MPGGPATAPVTQVAHILESNGVIHFPDSYTDGYGWEDDGA